MACEGGVGRSGVLPGCSSCSGVDQRAVACLHALHLGSASFLTCACPPPPPLPPLQIFDDMVAAGVQPNHYVVSALFAAASFAPCTPAHLDRLFAAMALLRR